MELPTDGGTMTVHALQAPGSGGRLSPAEGREANLNAPPFQANVMPDIHPPAEGLAAPEPVRGCHVQPKDYAWFQESLAHTAAAGLMAFTGSGHATALCLTVTADRFRRKATAGGSLGCPVHRPCRQPPPWTAPGWNLLATAHPLVATAVEETDAMSASQAFSSWIRAPRSSAHSSAHALSSSICREVSPYAM